MTANALQLIGKASPAWIVRFSLIEQPSAPLGLEAGGLLASPYADPACSWGLSAC